MNIPRTRKPIYDGIALDAMEQRNELERFGMGRRMAVHTTTRCEIATILLKHYVDTPTNSNETCVEVK